MKLERRKRKWCGGVRSSHGKETEEGKVKVKVGEREGAEERGGGGALQSAFPGSESM